MQHEAAQRDEGDDDARQPVIAAPWVRRRSESTITLTHVLFGANVAVYLAMALSSGSLAEGFSGPLEVRFGANYGPLTLTGDWWRLFSYMFLHANIMHIGFNMWCLWDLGALCESLYGRWTYAVIYLISGVAAGLASVGWHPGVLSVGASGAIFGLAGALLASFYLGEFSVPRTALQPTLRSLAFFVVINLVLGAGISIFSFGGLPATDNAAHVGGLVSGLILGALIATVAPQSDAPLRRVAVLGAVALIVAGAGVGIERWRGGPMRMGRAYEAIAENQPNKAIAQLQAIVRQQPNLVPAHFALAQAFFNVQKYDQAGAEFKRVLELQPQNTTARFDLGLVYLSQKRPEDAKTAFTEILNKSPNDADAHYGMGLALADAAQYQPAVDEFKKAISLGPQVTGVYFELGQAYARLKMYDDAIAAYIEGKNKEGDDPDLETALADAYTAKGMTQQAQDARNKATQLKGGRGRP